MIISSAAVYRFVLPLKYSLPLKGSSLANREGLIVELKTDQGKCRYGEASPLTDFSRESFLEAEASLVCVIAEFLEKNTLPEDLPASVSFAIESALDPFESDVSDRDLKVAPLLMGDRADILLRLENWDFPWPREFKLKVGRQSVEFDIANTLQILEILPKSVKLRLDANQQWTFNQAIAYAENIPVQRVSYIEEPMVTACRNEAFFHASGLGYALDETLQKKEYSYKKTDGLKALVIKPTLVGGLSRYQNWLKQARKDSVRIVFSSAFESHLGVDLIRRMAHEIAPDELHGFDTLSAFTRPLCSGLPDNGQRLSPEVLKSMERIWCSSIAH